MSVFCWGDNAWGQVGTIPATADLVPTANSTSSSQSGEQKEEGSKSSETRRQEIIQEREAQVMLNPVTLSALRGTHVSMVAAGESHTLLLDKLGRVWALGRNKEGQLGLGFRSTEGVRQAQPVHLLDDEKITQVACGTFHSLAVAHSGRAYTWGLLHTVAPGAWASSTSEPVLPEESEMPNHLGSHDEGGAVEMVGLVDGLSDTRRSYVMDLVRRSESTYEQGDGVSIAASLTTEGMGEPSQAGQFRSNVRSTDRRLMMRPWAIPDLPGNIVQAAGGYSFSVLLTADGRVWGFGYNDQGQLGLGHRSNQALPDVCQGLDEVNIVHIACGQQHTVAISSEGALYSFGSNIFGQIGIRIGESGRKRSYLTAAAVDLPESIVDADCGNFHSAAVGKSGKVYVWGHSEYAQLGSRIGSSREDVDIGEHQIGSGRDAGHRQAARVVDSLAEEHVQRVCCGHLFNLVITSSGKVCSWGWGDGGALGHGNQRYRLNALEVKALEGTGPVTGVAAGGKHSVVVTQSTCFIGLGKMLEMRPAMCDILFLVGRFRVPVPAHRFIIAARCPWLGAEIAMSLRFTEAGGSTSTSTAADVEGGLLTVALPQYDPKLFETVLEYLYCDSVVRIMPHQARRLASVAKRLHLPRLHAICLNL
ncbi:hypothetical protein CYMTET_23546, partial [Cymbomonas tetramitiformis]